MNRKELAHSLQFVKLVLGNGFDLHCGLRSSFEHYYIQSKDRIDYIRKWYDSFKKRYEDKHIVSPEDSRDIEQIKKICDLNNVRTLLDYSSIDLSHAIGETNIKVIGVLDKGFADNIYLNH